MVRASPVIFSAIALNITSALAAPVVRPFFEARGPTTKLFPRGNCCSARKQVPQPRSTQMDNWLKHAQTELFWDNRHTSPPHTVPPDDFTSDEGEPRSPKSDGSVSGSAATKLAAHIDGDSLAQKTVTAKAAAFGKEFGEQFQDGPSLRGHSGVKPARRDQGNIPPRLPQDLPTLLGIHLKDSVYTGSCGACDDDFKAYSY